jgi:hypothetical protein
VKGKKKNKENWCKVAKTIHVLPNGNTVFFKGVHNHPLSDHSKTDPVMKEKVLGQLSVGAKLSVIHTKLLTEAKLSVIHTKLLTEAKHLISSKDVPSKQAIHNWQHQMTMSQLLISMTPFPSSP